MSLVSTAIIKIISHQQDVFISKVALKSLQTRFKVTQWSLYLHRPFNANILLLKLGFHLIIDPLRSPPLKN